LNAAGRRFRPIAQDLVRRAEQAAETMAAVGRDEPVALTAVASPTTVAHFLAPFMAGAGPEGPALRDALQEEPSKVFDTLLRSDADLGISTVPAPAPLESAFLGRSPVLAQVPVGHPWSGRTEITLAELVTEPLILMTHTNMTRLVLDEVFAGAGLKPAAVTETGSSAFAQALAAAGKGVCLVTDSARFDLSELTVRTPDGLLTVPLYAGWDPARYARSAIQDLVEGLRDYCERHARRYQEPDSER
ncbi:LysR family transcriptional regulator substrate-binding protein, partial [Streptomyces sp. NRRL B-24572]|uniref:LysR family transcriptional regulator substrate-binding protein n=1 Tax=Streptomyces sp. NRRL B-24572 TaxID=1962156 RepID=UPI000A3D3BD1